METVFRSAQATGHVGQAVEHYLVLSRAPWNSELGGTLPPRTAKLAVPPGTNSMEPAQYTLPWTIRLRPIDLPP